MSDIYIDVTDECSFTPSHGTELYDNTLLKVLYTDPETSKNYTISKNINVYPREEFNKPYKISSLINDCSDLFRECTNFNQPITIGSNVDNCQSMFLGCESLDSDIKIGKNVEDCSYMFYRCYNFNSNVIIGLDKDGDLTDYVNTSNMFGYCTNLDKSINFSNNVLYRHENTFSFCTNLNKPIHLGTNVRSLSGVFRYCYNFNSEMTFEFDNNSIMDYYRSFDYIYYGCNHFDRPVYLPRKATQCISTMGGCENFNNYVDFSGPRETVKSLQSFFNGCTSYNYSDISLSSFPVLNNVSNLLYNCQNFNKNIYLNFDIVDNIYGILSHATSFDCFNSLKLGLESTTVLKDCSWAFYGCPMHFNVLSKVIISNSVENCGGMFHSCSNIYASGGFVFGNNVKNLVATFQNCSMIGDIYILQEQSCNVYAMLFNCPNQYIVNVHCPNLAIINKTSSSESITGYPMTWTYESAGTYYNSAYGIRITNNMVIV